MKLAAANECYQYYSGKTSDIIRQAAFAGIAVVWIFNQATPQVKFHLPPALIEVTYWLLATLVADLLHNLVSTAMWGVFHWTEDTKYERLKDADTATVCKYEDHEVDTPPWINWPGIGLFAAKVFFLGWAYVLLARYLMSCLTGECVERFSA